MKLSKKYQIKIPKDIKVIYSNNKNFLTIIGPLHKKSLKIKLELKILKEEKLIYVTKTVCKNLTITNKKLIYYY